MVYPGREPHMAGRLSRGVAVSKSLCSSRVMLLTHTSALTIGLERYIVYPPGVDFGKMLMTRQDERMSPFIIFRPFIHPLFCTFPSDLLLQPLFPNLHPSRA